MGVPAAAVYCLRGCACRRTSYGDRAMAYTAEDVVSMLDSMGPGGGGGGLN